MIGHQKAAFLKFELLNGDARRKKGALQELCRLYRSGEQLNSQARNEIEKTINGMLLARHQDLKVIRWGLNALAQFGRRSECVHYVEGAIKLYDGVPEIVAAGVAALSHLFGGELGEVRILGSVDPAIRILAALQNTPAAKLDLRKLSKIKIDTADPGILKLALITVGLNKDVENLFDPKHSNGQIVKALGGYDGDSVVVQYSVWAVLANKKLTISDLGIPVNSLESHPPNVQAKLLQLVAEKERSVSVRQQIIEQGTWLPSVDAREGLAKGLQYQYYDGLEDITLPWFDQETEDRVKHPLAEHFGRFGGISGPYESQAIQLLETDPALISRLLVGAEGTSLYAKIRGSNVREGTPDLFSNDALTTAIIGRPIVTSQTTPKTALLMFASPIGQTPLRLDQEARDLGEKIRLVQNPKVAISVTQHWAVRVDQIQDCILNARPHILHFSGHGGSGSLYFEDATGNATPVTSKAFGDLMKLASSHIECVIMNACYSNDLAKAAANHVNAVIGCKSSIRDDAAIAFARSFYRALTNGKDYRESFDWAVNEVRLATSDAEAKKYKFTDKKSASSSP